MTEVEHAYAEPAWGQRWQAVLDAGGASLARIVQRGQGLARRGGVEDLKVAPGQVGATVVTDRVRPYHVQLRCPTASLAQWEAAAAALRDQLRFTAVLLNGQLPAALADTLAHHDVDLLPQFTDIEVACDCDDVGPWCRHATAVHAATAALLDRDPTILLTLRGRSRDDLLADVRRGRSDSAETSAAIDTSLGLYAAHGDISQLELRPALADDPAGLLGYLGDPPGVDDPEPMIEIIERAAAAAWRLAAGDGAEAADQELLLAELRAQRMASAASLAEALGRDAEEVTEELDALFSAGTVMRTGSGDRARYRAASG